VTHTKYIPRRLTLEDRIVPEEEVLQDRRHVVVLAEPGAGKTELLENFSRTLGARRQRASVFRSRTNQECSGTIIIDGFDEVAKLDESAFDGLIGKVADTGADRVIIASRSSEWDSNRYNRLISEFLGAEPLVVRLKEFEDSEQRQLFDQSHPEQSFDDFKEAVAEFGMQDLLGNPQMLGIIALAYIANDGVFSSRAQIFSDALNQMCREHNPDIPAKARPSSKQLSVIGSELFAKLLLSGATGVRDSDTSPDRDFPFLCDLVETKTSETRQVIDTNLFKPSDEAGNHEPIHRIVAEYGAAQYLAKRINAVNDEFTLPRVLALVAPSGALRDDLRGLLAWLTTAVQHAAQKACIEVSPYAVLSNGDPSQLESSSKIHLIEELARLSEIDPYFRRSDRWRRFNTKGFFTTEVVDAVKRLLSTPDGKNDLRDLLLEIVEASGEEAHLEKELATILHSSEADFYTRLRAMNVLASVEGRNKTSDFLTFVQEGSFDGLRLSSEMVLSGFVNPPNDLLLNLLRALIPLHKGDDLALDQEIGSTYFISQLVDHFSNAKVTYFLSELTRDLKCICGKERSYECHCRLGISKLVGRLLDRYFQTTVGPHYPTQLWGWMKALNFRNARSERDSQSVNALQKEHWLRRAIQLLSIDGLSEDEEIWQTIVKLRHGEMHSGLFLTGEDDTWMIQHAASTGRIGMFSAFYRTHNWYSKSKGPSTHRIIQRSLSRSSPEFMRIAASKERSSREFHAENKEKRYRFQSRYRKRRERSQRADAEHFAKHQNEIAKGENWQWLHNFAHEYLAGNYDPDGVIRLAGNTEFIETALRSSVPFLMKDAPSLTEIGSSRAKGSYYYLPPVAYAAILAVYRHEGSLETVPPAFVAIARTDINVSHDGLSDEERTAFHTEIDRRLFPSKDEILEYLRSYIEPQLGSDVIDNSATSILARDRAFADVAEETAVRWLQEFPDMPLSCADVLISIAAKNRRNDQLCLVISNQCAKLHEEWPYGPPEKRQKDRRDFWFLRSFVFGEADKEWPTLSLFPDNIFAFSRPYDSLGGSREGDWPKLSARKVFLLLDAFIDRWPRVPLPSSWGSDSPKGETAFRFLNGLVWRISDDEPSNQIDYLGRILADPRFDKWHDDCRHLLVEAKRKHLLSNFSAPTPESVCNMLDSARVSTVEDMRALVVEELRAAERWFRHGETDPIEPFYDGGKHVNENTARNRIVERLEPKLRHLDIDVSIEAAMARQNRCDFTAVSLIEGRRTCLVVEVKGQWHSELFEAANTQLYERYSHHPDAAEQGIYLVLWFGPDEKVAGRTTYDIQTPKQLEDYIRRSLPDTLVGAIDVLVMDLSR